MIKIIEIKWAIKILRVINQISINNLQINLNLILINLMAQQFIIMHINKHLIMDMYIFKTM